MQDININNSSKNISFVNKNLNTINNENPKKQVKKFDYQNLLKEPNYLSKIQISNLDPANQDEEKNPDEIFSNENNKIPFDNNSKLLLSKVLHNNQKPKIPIKHNVINNIDDNAYNNFLLNLSNIQNFSIYNSIIYNDINNYSSYCKER